MYKSNNQDKVEQAFYLLENMALFNEEKKLLHSIIDRNSNNADIDMQKSSEISLEAKGVKTQIEKDYGFSQISYDPNSIKSLISKLKPRMQLKTKRNMMKRKYWKNALDLISSQNYIEAATEYVNKIKLLKENNHENQIPIALVMCIFNYLKLKNYKEAIRILEESGLHIGFTHEILQKYPEFHLLEILIDAQRRNKEMICDQIIEGFIQHLPLFEIEKELMLSLSGIDLITKIKQTDQTTKIKDSQNSLLLRQNIDNIIKTINGFKETSDSILNKRKAMKRIYYKKALETLKANDFKQASEHYKATALKLSQKNDYETSGIAILLGMLSLFKGKYLIEDIKNYLNTFLDELGFTKKIIIETVGIKLGMLLVDSYELDQSIFKQGWELLKNLPLLDEEKELLKENGE